VSQNYLFIALSFYRNIVFKNIVCGLSEIIIFESILTTFEAIAIFEAAGAIVKLARAKNQTTLSNFIACTNL